MAQARSAVVAIRPFEYRGQPAVSGDVCVVSPAEAASLVYRRQARWPNGDEALGVYDRRDMAAANRSQPQSRRRSRRRDASSDAGT